MSKKLDSIKQRLEKAKEMLLEKAIKPGPTLDYAKINPKDNTQISPEAKATVAATNAATEAAAPSIDYKSGTMEPPKRYAGAAEKAAQVRAKVAAQMAPRTAHEEFMSKLPANKKPVMKSEDEPHADPNHEKKEQKKAKKIKKEAQAILDMHKNDGVLLDEEHTPKESVKMKL